MHNEKIFTGFTELLFGSGSSSDENSIEDDYSMDSYSNQTAYPSASVGPEVDGNGLMNQTKQYHTLTTAQLMARSAPEEKQQLHVPNINRPQAGNLTMCYLLY